MKHYTFGYARVSTEQQNLDRVTEGDTVVIESLSRLGRSTKDLID